MNGDMFADLTAYFSRNPNRPATMGITGNMAGLIITDDIDLTENNATRKLADRDARVAVEGDTDLNHDNVEGAE